MLSNIFLFILGGEFDNDRKMEDLKLLYRAYVAESFSSGQIEESKVHIDSSIR